ncbi:hypothetical protein HPB50_027188 [Hyalomma asiaticum]|uniref:Uncharacterized protein n=1 Tax=Hyalomma asiaticum TaxID=266040 RepID=A0ACB7TPL2_HYAAI|nr:hypothetical protein HPB50_027188 [Hyalomma asiaticum]
MSSRRRRVGQVSLPRGRRREESMGSSNPLDEVNEIFAGLHRNAGVVGVIATLSDGAVIKSTMPGHDETNRYAMMAAGLCKEARNAMGSGPQDQPKFFEVKNESREILITLGPMYTLIVVKTLEEPHEEASQ